MSVDNQSGAWRGWITNAGLCCCGVALLLLSHQFVVESQHFEIGFSGVSGWSAWAYVAAVLIVMTQPVNRATVWIVLVFAVAFQAVTLPAKPFLSSDIYRYVWDGITQHAHVNPYRYVPGDPALSYLRAPHQEIFDNINRRDYARTIYPPVAQMIYWAVTLLSPTVQAMKIAMFGFECVTAWALLKMLESMQRRRAEVLLFAWCPLLVWEIGGAGHVDAAVFGFVALALLMRWREKPGLVGLFLGCAVMTKFYPLVLFPALWKRWDWKMPAVLAAVCAVGYAMYSSVGKLVFGFLGGYSKEEGMDSGKRYFLLELVQHVRGLAGTTVGMYMIFCAAIMGGIALWAWKYATVEAVPIVGASGPKGKSGEDAPAFVRAAWMLGFAMMLLFSPHYPWYVVWLIPFFTLSPDVTLLTYLIMFFYLFTTPLADGTASKMYVLNRILYGATLAVWALYFILRRMRSGRWLPMRENKAVA